MVLQCFLGHFSTPKLNAVSTHCSHSCLWVDIFYIVIAFSDYLVITLPENMFADLLSFLSTKPEGFGFNGIARQLAQLGYTPLYTARSKNQLRLHPKTLRSLLEDAISQGLVESDYPLGKTPKGKRNLFRLTNKGIKFLTRHKIRSMWGLVGLRWAEEAWKKGYKIHFLGEFTNLEGHDGLLLAWHPGTGDVRIAEIFGVGEFQSSPEGPEYRGQYVDRKVKPDAPIRSATLRQFIKDNVEDLRNDQEVGKAVKRFYEEHNSFTAVLVPEKIHFGFPKKDRVQEIGRFGSLMFVGFKGEGDMPFIERMNIMAGGFNLSENLNLLLSYDVNLIALYSYAWLMVKRQVDPSSVDPKQLEAWLKKTWFAGFNPNITIACKNADGEGYCRKLKRKCVALEIREGKPCLNFRRCHILLNDSKNVAFHKSI